MKRKLGAIAVAVAGVIAKAKAAVKQHFSYTRSAGEYWNIL